MRIILSLVVMAFCLLFPSCLRAQAPPVTGTCVSGCPGSTSGGHVHESSAAEVRRQEEHNAAIDRYNRDMRNAHHLFEKGRKASDQRKDLEAIDLFRRAYAVLLSVKPVDQTSLDDKEKRLVRFREAIAFSEFNLALGIRSQRDWNGALSYLQQALYDYPSDDINRAQIQAELEKTRKMQASQLQQQQEAARRRIEAEQWRAAAKQMQTLLNAGKVHDEQLATPSVDLDKPQLTRAFLFRPTSTSQPPTR
jgi:tetratricopeptide (TPR) repeat protein